ncbi:MAG: nucleoside hydrolase [Phycisphaeraceae bacterium]|nr:nucleoside hydrolase [Phycisphaeraceae bacterium]
MSAPNFSTTPPDATPVPLILDTDMGNDIDDALALALIHALQSRGECQLLGVAISKDNPWAAVYTDVVNTFYGRGEIPIGVVRDGVTPNDRTFIRQISSLQHNGRPLYRRTHAEGSYEDAVPMLRRLLAGQPDRSVVLVMIGFATNMARLLDSPADDHSPLDGTALVRRKVRQVVAMAANFSSQVQQHPTMENREYNIHSDAPAAARFFNHCPAPVLFCGFEIGEILLYPATSIESDYNFCPHHPVADAYCSYRPMPYDRPCWDPATVLAAVRPEAGYFQLSEPGQVHVDEQGIVLFHSQSDGSQRYLILPEQQRSRVLHAILTLCIQPPGEHRKPVVVTLPPPVTRHFSPQR